MRIYFSDSRRKEEDFHRELKKHLEVYGEVVHRKSHDKLDILLDSDLVVAEISNINKDLSYDLRRAIKVHKPILCLYHTDKKDIRLPQSCNVLCVDYDTLKEAKQTIDVILPSGLGLSKVVGLH